MIRAARTRPVGSVWVVDRTHPRFETWRTSFSGAVRADAYDAVRPSYPADAVDWALGRPGQPCDVLDLGAGTGILTSVLSRLGHRVTAVDPSETMLARLRRREPSVRALVGTGEAVPLEDASVDAVVVGQAWHWVDPDRAGPELARVLRPGGWVGLLWNSRDAGVPWVAELYQVAGEPVRDRGDVEGAPRVPGPFGPVEARMFDNPHRLASAADVGRLAGTWSWVRTAPDPEALMAQVAAVAGRNAAPDGSVTVPQTTEAFRLRRFDQAATS